MTFIEAAFVAISCFIAASPVPACPLTVNAASAPAAQPPSKPLFSGAAVDVIISAESALVWDEETGEILYAKNADRRRPIASLTKLLSVLLVRSELAENTVVEIPAAVLAAQRSGANIRLPVGEHASVHELLQASLIASANDAVVALAEAAAGSEAAFVEQANLFAAQQGLTNTHAANATGLSGGEQYSTAHDVRRLLTRVYHDPILKDFLADQGGTLTTVEGTKRTYKTTNKLLGTYLPIIAAKTGYTVEAGQNLAIITEGEAGQRLGAVILGSDERFQDMKILVEWIWRNYTWPEK